MGAAVIFVITLFKYCYEPRILSGAGSAALRVLQTIAFILVIAALVQFVEMFLKKSMLPVLRAGYSFR